MLDYGLSDDILYDKNNEAFNNDLIFACVTLILVKILIDKNNKKY